MIGWPGALALALAAGFVAAAACSWPTVSAEFQSARAEAQTTEALGGPAPLPWEEMQRPAECAPGCPPRVAAAVGVRLAYEASAASDIRTRLAKAAQAESLLIQALGARPAAGEWWAWLAFARIGAGDEDAPVIQALVKSYQITPFLPQLAGWRVGLAGRFWAELPDGARLAAADEGAFLEAVAPLAAKRMLARVSDPGARRALSDAFSRAPSVPHGIGRDPGGVGLGR